MFATISSQLLLLKPWMITRMVQRCSNAAEMGVKAAATVAVNGVQPILTRVKLQSKRLMDV